MSDTTTKEKFAIFVSYVKLIAFVAIFGLVGLYVYNRSNTTPVVVQPKPDSVIPPPEPTPTPAKPVKPSLLLSPVMEANLTALFGSLDDQVKDLSPDFTALEREIDQEKIQAGPQQGSWNAASSVCKEVRRIAAERNAVANSLKILGQPPKSASVVLQSKTEPVEPGRKEFFIQSAKQRWKNTLPERRKKIDALYGQLQAAENLSAGLWDTK